MERTPNQIGELQDRAGLRLRDTNLLVHYSQQAAKDRSLYIRLRENPPLTWQSDYFASPIFDGARFKEQLIFELYLGRTAPSTDAVSCPKCGKTNVQIRKEQKAAGDEGGVASGICQSCGNVFPLR